MKKLVKQFMFVLILGICFVKAGIFVQAYDTQLMKYQANAEPVNQESSSEAADALVLMEGDQSASVRNKVIFSVLMVLLIGILIILIRVKLEMGRKSKKAIKEQQRNQKKAAKAKERLSNLDIAENFYALEEFDLFNEQKVEIAVKNVTMQFRREKDEASSFKEFVIRALKGQRSYEQFKALNDVSFTVKSGEVVGIIGTNGSGKSTLLKIISGALEPTKGSVEVDKKKVQLLTLGTGFDYELTGRENVYLNGAIIGYSKEFIDEKYDAIVEFAELEGFMEEKVRNYSTGMVARLGFAISTIRDVPEIVILDEVLSVGDMFFRKKSEGRIKKMIRSGATVLIVSHSPSVIRTNCTRAVWIEKGILKAVGDAREVCAAYEQMSR